MTPPLPNEPMLERQLAELTTWEGADPELWRAALEKTSSDKRKPRMVMERFLTWPVPKLIAASLLVVLIGIIIVALMLPSARRTRTESSVAQMSAAPARTDFEAASPRFIDGRKGELRFDLNGDSDGGSAIEQRLFQFRAPGGSVQTAKPDHLDGSFASEMSQRNYAPIGVGDAGTNPESTSQSSAERSVIRKATIELITDDVRSTFLKAMQLVSEAGGEYIQDSALTGTGKEAQANLTLRVSIDRLSAVLNDLRNLGKVRAETVNGEDVTAQVVDLEARLRNEQRVEAELLQLLEKRNDAPLKEILELRTSIAQVRQQIEQIVAQREKLSRLVALATVLVIIKPENAPAPPPEEKKQTIGQYFGHAIATDWHNGLQVLADTLAGAVKILVGGLVWWVALIAGLMMLRQYLRRRAALAGV